MPRAILLFLSQLPGGFRIQLLLKRAIADKFCNRMKIIGTGQSKCNVADRRLPQAHFRLRGGSNPGHR
jgi:hypothetical protein